MKQFPFNAVDYYDTFPAYLAGISAKYGAQPAVSYFTRKQEKVTHTYHELGEDVLSLGESLCARGLAGKHIALVGENSYEWLVACLAAMVCGGVAVCIDIEQPDDSIREMLHLSDAQGVFASAPFQEICTPFFPDSATAAERLFLLGGAPDSANPMTLAAFCEEGRALRANGYNALGGCAVSPDQTAAIVFTSGTTSQSKLVMLSHRNMLKNMCDSWLYVTFEKVVFCSLPFYHAYGITCALLGSLLRGAHTYINGDLRTMMRDLLLAQPDTMLTVPLVVEAIYSQLWMMAEKEGIIDALRATLKRGKFRKKLNIPRDNSALVELKRKLLGNLHILICGGAHLGKEISEDFEAFGIQILQGYGITECSPLISVSSNHSCKMGSVGIALPSCEVKLVDGEFWVRGESVMSGYYNAPELTAEVLEDGWFKTGDLGYLDKDGFLYLTGRKKNLIVFKNGKKISPEKLEEKLIQIPLVKEVLIS
ncbi:MAG: AMP-binding protein, partial [Clostridiales bacterium]|nr:AMP-binding protein [Clostridiales bacterium]